MKAPASHHQTAPQSDAAGSAPPRVTLVGNPNVGKSTLFNLLTGAHQKTMNAPRTTVTFAAGQWRLGGAGADSPAAVQLVDLPGTYSLLAHSPDEQVTADAVAGLPLPANDPARPPGQSEAAQAGGRQRGPDLVVAVVDANAPASSLYLVGQLAVLGSPLVVALTMADVARSGGAPVDADRLSRALGVPVVETDPRRGRGAGALAASVAAALAAPAKPSVRLPAPAADPRRLAELADPLLDWVAAVTAQAGLERPPKPAKSDHLDRWLLKWWVGGPVFLAVLWAVFQLTTVVAGPLQDICESFVTGTVGGWTGAALAAVGWGGGWLESLLRDGVLAGLGVVVSFLPLMAIMFLAIALLEDSGYMARAALVCDRLMRLIGLDGRAMLPLVIGFGCNLPALAATRTLPNARQRLLTGLLVPYAACTARLVIFLFIASVFFPRQAGTVVFLMYLVSVAVIVLVGLALRRTAFRGVGEEPLILVLPPYQVPRPWPLTRSVALRCRDFALKAGRVIVLLTILVWALLSTPVAGGHAFGDSLPPRDSALGAAAQAVAPVFAPAGFDDWHATASLMSGFVAKEAAVGTLATTFGMDEPADPSRPGDLSALVQSALESSSGGHGGAAALAYMFFCLGYTPCMVAVAEQR
ncbi:MAG: ferrous iron transporter B, partial [Bifidobacteriaceae bacterium]|nr:ferrous iron transporter B [Bifidobacteriaceae bacterium]